MNPHTYYALKANQDRVNMIIADLDRQIAENTKKLEDLERSNQSLRECKAILRDHGRLIELDMKKA